MARRGRKPKPTALKLLEGTRADRVNDREPAMPTGLPERPDYLAGPARAEWDRMIELLRSSGVLSRADGAALALYCQTYGRWREAEDNLALHGCVVEAVAGGAKTSPYVGIAHQCLALMHRLLVEFGLTPSSRSRIKSTVEKPKDALEEFLAG